MIQEINTGKMIDVVINGEKVSIYEGTTILDAARKVNVKIPTLYIRILMPRLPAESAL